MIVVTAPQSTTNHDATQDLSPAKSYRDWANIFARNTQRWATFAKGIEFETLRIEPAFIESIKTFQLGEQSEGRTLKALAAQHAKTKNEPDYLLAMQQFIGEEQRHAQYLAIALKANNAAPMKKQWTDGLFRKLRKLCGLEMMISVLLTAEVIAITYYSTLAKASTERQASQLFERILQDEATHLQFHGEHLSQLRCGPYAIRWQLHRVLMWTVATLVWIEHRHVLKHQFASFWHMLKRCDTLLMNLK